MARGRIKKKERREGLMLTSMMDFLTIILLFLLKQYSAEGSITTNADNLVLPNSISKKKPKEVTLQVAVTEGMIMVDNNPVCPTDDARNIPQDQEKQIVKELHDRLKKSYEEEQELVKMGALNEMKGKIVVQIDKNVSFDVMYKVMVTCGEVGYRDMNFAVMQRED